MGPGQLHDQDVLSGGMLNCRRDDVVAHLSGIQMGGGEPQPQGTFATLAG
jgi:hypothetical protein